MDPESPEADYLARAKPPTDIESFAQTVREAFALEHNAGKDVQIAQIMSISTGRVSQILNGPKALKAETVQHLLSCFASRTHRKNIFTTWQRECFGEELFGPGSPRLIGETVDEKTMRRIDRLIREARLDRALRITTEALEICRDPEFKMPLLTKAYWLNHRLDRPGDAMAIATMLFQWGKQDPNTNRMARALQMRIRILRGLEGDTSKIVTKVCAEALAFLEANPKSPSTSAWDTLPEKSAFLAEKRASIISAHEQTGGYENILKKELRSLEAKVGDADSRNAKFGNLQAQARIHLALGKPMKAEGLLEESFKAGEFHVLNSHEQTSLIQGKILAAKGSLDEAVEYYRQVLRLCEEQRSLYHYRLAQHDLALLLSGKFPPSHPA